MEKRAVNLVKKLIKAGHEAYFVGGLVRDMLMNRPTKDVDITTSARPEEILRIFPGSRVVGARFGVVIVSYYRKNYEIATFRADGVYKDGRRPESVRFTDANEDVFRRDFTINGLLYDPVTGTIQDFVNGRKDIEAKIIRTIGNPDARFAEDKLRMLRAVRFASVLDFSIEPDSFASVKCHSAEIEQISNERIRDELSKILLSGNAEYGIRLLDESGLLKHILPEISAMKGVAQPEEFHPEGDVFTHTLHSLRHLSASSSVELALGVLLHDVAKPVTFSVSDRIRFNHHPEEGAVMAEEICRRLRYPEKTVRQVSELVKNHLRFKDVKKMKMATFKKFISLEKFSEHLQLHRLDCLGSHGRMGNYEFTIQKMKEIPPEEISPKKLITGKDLIEAGYRPGPGFTEMLAMAEELQLEGAVQRKDQALQAIKKKFGNNR